MSDVVAAHCQREREGILAEQRDQGAVEYRNDGEHGDECEQAPQLGESQRQGEVLRTRLTDR